MRFPIGQVVATPGALELVGHEGAYVLLRRHGGGDWGDLDGHDRRANDEALGTGARLFSAYDTEAGQVWIITESSREVTTILLPSEY